MSICVKNYPNGSGSVTLHPWFTALIAWKSFTPAPPGFFESELLIFFLHKNHQNYLTRMRDAPAGSALGDALHSWRVIGSVTLHSWRAIAPYTLRSDREELLHSRGTNIFFPLLFCKFIKRISVINRIRFSYHGSKSFQASELTKFSA